MLQNKLNLFLNTIQIFKKYFTINLKYYKNIINYNILYILFIR